METKRIAAGVLAIDKVTGHILLGKRSLDSSFPSSWAPFGGKFETKDETPKNAAKRELKEESGLSSDTEYQISKSPFYIQDEPELTFYTYIGIFDGKFPVTIDKEHISFGWYPLDNLPEYLHPGFAELIENKKTELEEIIRKLKEDEK